MAVVPVDKNPDEWPEDKIKYLAGKSNYAQDKGRISEAIDQPAHRDCLHPGADERNSLAAKKKPVVSIAKRTEDYA
jgi:hypothetical protein